MSSLPWAGADWRAEVASWVAERLAELGIEGRGDPVEFRLRPWSALFTVPTGNGRLWFKALPPGLEHEVPLTVRLAEWFPSILPPLLAADQARGWMLMPDGGEQFREAAIADREGIWLHVLRGYAALQRAAVPRVEELLAVGVPDRRLDRLASMYDEMLAQAETTTRLRADPFRPEEMARLEGQRRDVLALGERLGGFGLPSSIQHDDLHDRNILVREDKATIFDWGDACIGHPLFSLRDALMSIAAWLGVDYLEQPAGLEPYVDAYLEQWAGPLPLPALHEAARLARPLSIITRLLSWELAVKHAGQEERERDAAWVVQLQRELIEVMSRAPFDGTPV